MVDWYFAYGSNLSIAQMVARTGPIGTGESGPRIAYLPNYRLAFNMSGGDGFVYANIVQPGEGVFGVVYRCRRLALEILDQYEQGYHRHELVVVDGDGFERTAFVYLARPERVIAEAPPSANYLRKIVEGAREHGLPQAYIQTIEAAALPPSPATGRHR